MRLVICLLVICLSSTALAKTKTQYMVDTYFDVLSEHEIEAFGKFSGVLWRRSGGRCGAVMVAKRWILTAAHCAFILKNKEVTAYEPRNYQVISNVQKNLRFQAFPMEEKRRFYVSQVILSDDYNENDTTFKNDWALIELTQDLPYQKYPKFRIPTLNHDLEYFYLGAPLVRNEQGRYDVSLSEKFLRTNQECPIAEFQERSGEVNYHYFYLKKCIPKSVSKGLSGSPAFVEDNGQYYVVGINAQFYKGAAFQVITPELLEKINKLQQQ